MDTTLIITVVSIAIFFILKFILLKRETEKYNSVLQAIDEMGDVGDDAAIQPPDPPITMNDVIRDTVICGISTFGAVFISGYIIQHFGGGTGGKLREKPMFIGVPEF